MNEIVWLRNKILKYVCGLRLLFFFRHRNLKNLHLLYIYIIYLIVNLRNDKKCLSENEVFVFILTDNSQHMRNNAVNLVHRHSGATFFLFFFFKKLICCCSPHMYDSLLINVRKKTLIFLFRFQIKIKNIRPRATNLVAGHAVYILSLNN